MIARFYRQDRTPRAAKLSAATLALSLLVLHAGLFSQVAAHSLQHAHHQASTHGSLLCTWLCTAGEISEAVAGEPSTLLAVVAHPEPGSPGPTVPPLSIEPSSRAPPPGSPSTRS